MVRSIAFQYALKPNTKSQFQSILREAINDQTSYRDFLLRYDIYSSKVWLTVINQRDYVFFYHDIGPSFEEKSTHFPTSEHAFDAWLRQSLESVYDAEGISVDGYTCPVFSFNAIEPTFQIKDQP